MASHSVICYPQPGKAKSAAVLEAFAAGCGGRASRGTTELEPGAAAFFGVVGIEHLVRLCRASSREWYYGDNSFFDVSRGRYFRFAKNALQVGSPAAPDHERLRRLGLRARPWRRAGSHVVVAPQSPQFCQLAGLHPLWLGRVVEEIRRHTDRPIRIRPWTRDKAKASASLHEDLADAWALVTHSSAAANEALLAGVPVFVGSKECAAATMASGGLEAIENPRLPDGRDDWAAGLAAMQWTLGEIREGAAWKALAS